MLKQLEMGLNHKREFLEYMPGSILATSLLWPFNMQEGKRALDLNRLRIALLAAFKKHHFHLQDGPICKRCTSVGFPLSAKGKACLRTLQSRLADLALHSWVLHWG